MRHSKATLYLEAYDQEELTPRVRSRLEEHLAQCPRCAGRAEKAASLGLFLSRLTPDPTPPGFEEAVERVHQGTLRAIREPRTRPMHSVPLWLQSVLRPPVAIPATLAAVLLLVLVLRAVGPAESLSPPRHAVGRASPVSSAPHDFRVVREGSEVKIEWPQNGTREH